MTIKKRPEIKIKLALALVTWSVNMIKRLLGQMDMNQMVNEWVIKNLTKTGIDDLI